MTSGIARRTKLVTQPYRLIRSRSIGTTAAAAVQAVRRIVDAIKGRRELTRLAELDDRMLADIGLRRSDLDAARSGPLLQDPTSILEEHGRHLR
jgi:uncharacterized protein YjiS (DUF1127 family)